MAKKVTAQQALSKLDSQLECPLCLDYFKEPKLLPCFHVFCRSPCLEKLVSKDGGSLTCPTCRHVVPLAGNGVAGLQSDFHISHLFEIKEAFDKVSDSPESAKCDSCEVGVASGYCHDCRGLVCAKCEEAHRQLATMRDHRIVTLEDLKTEASSILSVKKALPKCHTHPELDLRIYCETCSTLICYDCTISLHREHTYDLVSALFPKHRDQLLSALTPIKGLQTKVKGALKLFDNRSEEILAQRVSMEADIKTEIEHQYRLLELRQEVLMRELEELTQQKIKCIASQKDQLEITDVTIASCLEFAEGGLETRTEHDVLGMKASVTGRVEQILSQFDSDLLNLDIEADMKLLQEGKKQLEKASHEFLEVSGLLSLKHSRLTGATDSHTGEKTSLSLQVKSIRNKPLDSKLKIVAELVNIRSKAVLKCQVTRHGRGAHKIMYCPSVRGDYELHMTINDSHMTGSPYPVRVAVGKPAKVFPGLSYPTSVVVNSKDEMLVVDKRSTCVTVLSAEGKVMMSFGEFNNAMGLTVDHKDNVYVLDCGYHTLHKFSPAGHFLKKVGSKGSGKLQFYCPVGIRYNPADNQLYIADQTNHRVQVLDTELGFVREIGSYGSNEGKFAYVFDIAFDDCGNMYATDHNNSRVQVFNPRGDFVRAFSKTAEGVLSQPWSVTVASDNTVFVAERNSHVVHMFSPQGNYLGRFGGQGSGCGEFENVRGLTSSGGSVIVSDYGNGRLQLFT